MFAIAVAGAVLGRSDPPPQPVKSPEQAKVDAAKEAQFRADVVKLKAFRAALKNPASFELVSVGRLAGGTLCLTYRGTNSFNAVTTEQKAITPEGKVAEFSKLCAGKSGEDLNYIRHAL